MWEKVFAHFPDAYFMPLLASLLAKLRANRVQSTVSLRHFRYGAYGMFAAVAAISWVTNGYFLLVEHLYL